MKHFAWIALVTLFFNCKNESKTVEETPVVVETPIVDETPVEEEVRVILEKPIVVRDVASVAIEGIFRDAAVSVRTLEILNDKSLAFAANNGLFGLNDPKTGMWQTSTKKQDDLNLNFRATGHTAQDFFMLTIESPALLYKTGSNGRMTLVYKEEGEGVFYDAMTFWDDKDGIAIGDSVNGCMSVIITRDGGATWKKLDCSQLPQAEAGEGAFAASNTNIKVLGNKVWFGTTHGNIYSSEDRGLTWSRVKTPIAKGSDTEGIYSIDFYDAKHGFAIGGDFKNPEQNVANKIRTSNGGKTWELVAENQLPGYSSCVQYVPNNGGKALIATSFNGIDFSKDSGDTWTHLSDAGFYTFRFLNDSIAYAAGDGKISKLTFREEDY
ncbi:WD40/YVTN/BNR-like repeat-containing protein [Tamlana sp. I1]|uniref:WD40/YVTN/BNR-like repeat-containing protein n=1 Tax=Tamlana sp. I1 TaxID=2762061 RepID=UPI00188F627C|nr:oxidoreductase [Tamlana sp. I1]